MTISSNSQILAADYNTLQSNTAAILDSYGLTYSATPVAGSNYYSYPLTGNPKIQAADWARLSTDIKIAANHQGITSNASIRSLTGASFTGVIVSGTLTVSSVTGVIAIGDPLWGTGITPGTYITAGSGLSWTVSPSQSVTSRAMRSGGNIAVGDLITFRDSALWPPAVTAITTNQYALAQYSDESYSPDISSTRTTAWGGTVPTIYHAFTIDFSATANKGKYFFNSGSNIRISASRAGGTGTPQDTNWTSLLTNMGTVIFGYNSTTRTGTSGTGSSIGFFGLTNTDQTIFSAAGSGSYATNTYIIKARSNVANNSSGTARYVYITISFTDTHTNPFGDTVTAPTTTNTTLLGNTLQSVFSLTYPTNAVAPFSWSVTGGQPNETWYAVANSALYGTVRIPASGTNSLDANGAASYPSATFGNPNIWTVTFYFSQSGDYVRKISLFELRFPSAAAQDFLFPWSVVGGQPNESWYFTTTAPGSPNSGPLTLDSTGAASFTNGNFGNDTGTITLTFYFSQSGTYTRTITITPRSV